MYSFLFFFFNDTATTEIYTLSLTTLFRSLLISVMTLSSIAPACPVRPHGTSSRKPGTRCPRAANRSEEHTSELQSRLHIVCRLLLEDKQPRHRYDAAPRPWIRSTTRNIHV